MSNVKHSCVVYCAYIKSLINILQAFDNLTTYYDQPERDVTFNIKCGQNNAKGIFLRGKMDDNPKDIAITVEPQFLEDHTDQESEWI